MSAPTVSALPSPALPASAVLATWLQAHRAGTVGVDELAEEVRQHHPRTMVVWPDGADELSRLPARTAGRVSLALPVPGDPLGLAGPPELNHAVLDAGEAVLIGTVALVPYDDARTLVWQARPAQPAPWVDERETGLQLRTTLVEVTRRLVELDVASWSPEIPDLLLNLDSRPGVPLPPHTEPRRVETVERAVLCREIVALGRADDGGSVSGQEMRLRREAFDELDRVARHALVGACSAPA